MRTEPAASRGALRQWLSDAFASMREGLRRVPRAAWICALIACLNAVCWSVITPPFQAPDEPSHFAYVQQLAETAHPADDQGAELLPGGGNRAAGPASVGSPLAPGSPPHRHAGRTATPAARPVQPLRRTGEGGAGVASSQPPLYYALQAIPYGLGSGGTLLDRLELMRLLSALMAGLTALFVYLFLREALPGVAWAWTVGGSGVALAPLLGFMSGVVNPDAMLIAVSAADLLSPGEGVPPRPDAPAGNRARCGDRGRAAHEAQLHRAPAGDHARLDRAHAPRGADLPTHRLSLSGARGGDRREPGLRVHRRQSALESPGAGRALERHPPDERTRLGVPRGQLHLAVLPAAAPGDGPRLPGLSATRQIWFDRSVGLYGWLDTPLPVWVQNLALIPAIAIAILAVRELVAVRPTLRRRLVEVVVYAVIGAGVLVLVGGRLVPCLPLTGGYLRGGALPAAYGPSVRRRCSRLALAAPADAGGRRLAR